MSTLATAPARAGSALVDQDQQRVEAELLTFPALHFSGLPVPVKFRLHGHGITQEIVCSTERLRELPKGIVWFDGEEIRALAIAAQAERLWPSDFKGYCLRKLHDPSFRVTEGIALDGAQPDPSEPAWPLGRVLERLDLRLGEVTVSRADDSEESDPPPVNVAA